MDNHKPRGASERGAARLRARLDEIDVALAGVRSRVERLRALEREAVEAHKPSPPTADLASPADDPRRSGRRRYRLALVGIGAGVTLAAASVARPHSSSASQPTGQGGETQAPDGWRDGPGTEGPREGPAELARQREIEQAIERAHAEYEQALDQIKARAPVTTPGLPVDKTHLEELIKREQRKAKGALRRPGSAPARRLEE